MQRYCGLNSYYVIDQIIQSCLNDVSKHPFEKYIMIVDNKDVVEEHSMKYTQYLVNIEIMNWKQFLKQLQLELHLTNKNVISDTYLTYIIRHILNTEDFTCFNKQYSYNLISELNQLILSYESFQVNNENSEKLHDFMHLYQSVKNYLNNDVLQLESIFEQVDMSSLDNRHIYIEANHLYTTQQLHIIQQLNQVFDVTLFYYYQNDKRLLNMPYQHLCIDATIIDEPTIISKNIFNHTSDSKELDYPIYQYHSGSMYQEVNQCVYSIYQKIVDEGLHYRDFMIIYSDHSYVDLLKDALYTLHMPHNMLDTKETKYEASYQAILKKIEHSCKHTFKEYAEELLAIDKLNPVYIGYLEELQTFQDTISNTEMKDFFKATFPSQTIESSRIYDCIQVCDITHVQASVPKHIYFLGLNETICPYEFKNTSLLLDEDILMLREINSPTPLTSTQKLGMHQNDIVKALTQPCLSLTLSCASLSLNEEELIPSTLFTQLKNMLHPLKVPSIAYLPREDYYMSGGQDEDKDILNHNINAYQLSSNQPNDLTPELINLLYTPHMSVSQIETYNQCPFLYFMKYGLKVHPLLDNTLQPNELGSLVHYILKVNVNQNRNIHDITTYYLSQNEDFKHKVEANKTNQYFIEQVEKSMDSVLKILKYQLSQSHFKVTQKEMKIEDDIEDIHFKGFIDRYDTYEDYSCIVDYKSSHKDIDLNLAMQGFNIQMLVYLKMVTHLNETKPGAVLYFNSQKHILPSSSYKEIKLDDYIKQYQYGGYVIDDGSLKVIHALDPHINGRSQIINVQYVKSKDNYKGHVLSDTQLDHLIDIIEKHIVELYQNISDGQINISPKGSEDNSIHHKVNPCRYCVYHSVCSFDAFYNDYDMVEDLDVEGMIGGDSHAV
ncbi:MAG: PD-(D/E)XK nuclease family protein [Erysipelotrichaceae bacterium]|nr:PD-(D/E)XK nuclease family protein [Erysipelotrichaceae bacterium]